MKIFAAVVFFFILYSLGSALYYMYKDKGQSKRMVKSLSMRIGLSIFLFVVMMIYTRFEMMSMENNNTEQVGSVHEPSSSP